MILVVGGGLAGLSAAYRLQEKKAKYLLVEAEKEVGGLCRSVTDGDYIFDYAGHLLCLRNSTVLQWVNELLEGELRAFERKACIYLNGSWIPYPFQAHIGALPDQVMRECLGDFILATLKETDNISSHPGNLGSWLRDRFGEGICRYFFVPYNEKLFGIPISELAHTGLEWSIPRPSLNEVIDGALGGIKEGMGYNPVFHYPSKGGIEGLPRALAGRLTSIKFSCGLMALNWRRKLAFLTTGEIISYENIISTIPLPSLFRLLKPDLSWIEQQSANLRSVSVWVLNVGVRRESVSDQHWIYFPEKKFPFYRVGCYTAFGPHLAPQGCSSLYVEVAGHAVSKVGRRRWIKDTLEALVHCGILRSTHEVEVIHPIWLPVAYVVHDMARLKHLPGLLDFLHENGIYGTGRYGFWGYGTMEDAILQGRDAADKVTE